MKTLEIQLPTMWKEISMEMFDKIIFELNGDYSKLEPSTAVIKALTNLSYDEISNMDVVSYQNIVNKLQFMNTYPAHNKIPDETITLNNKNYSVLLNPKKMTAAQFIDYKNLLMNADKIKNIQAKLLAVFIIPENHKYGDGYDFDKLADEIYHYLPIEYAIGLSYFFEIASSYYMTVSLQSLVLDAKIQMIKNYRNKELRTNLKTYITELKNLKKGIQMMNILKKKRLMKLIGHK